VDPSGATTGGIADIAAAKAGDPTLSEVAAQVGKNKIGINFVWVLLTGFMVFFMQAGFALVEAGFTRAKNATHTMAMNLMVFLVGAIGYYVLGFGADVWRCRCSQFIGRYSPTGQRICY